MPKWHYLRSTPHCAVNAQILDHMMRGGRTGELVSAAYYQNVIYYALSSAQGCSAVICPLDRSGEFGRFTIGYTAFDEGALPEDYPSVWARCPDQIIAALDPTSHVGASEWRTRCVSYRSAMSALGRITQGCLIRLARPIELDGTRCRLLQCLEARAGRYQVLDAAGVQPVHLSRDAIAEHGGKQCSVQTALEELGSGFSDVQFFIRRKSR